MKKLILLAIIVSSCTSNPKDDGCIIKAVPEGINSAKKQITIKDLNLKKGDLFYFGYNESTPTLFDLIDFNNNGVYAVNDHEIGEYNVVYFTYHDLFYAKNFKKVD